MKNLVAYATPDQNRASSSGCSSALRAATSPVYGGIPDSLVRARQNVEALADGLASGPRGAVLEVAGPFPPCALLGLKVAMLGETAAELLGIRL
jgi:hypothetical protein